MRAAWKGARALPRRAPSAAGARAASRGRASRRTSRARLRDGSQRASVRVEEERMSFDWGDVSRRRSDERGVRKRIGSALAPADQPSQGCPRPNTSAECDKSRNGSARRAPKRHSRAAQRFPSHSRAPPSQDLIGTARAMFATASPPRAFAAARSSWRARGPVALRHQRAFAVVAVARRRRRRPGNRSASAISVPRGRVHIVSESGSRPAAASHPGSAAPRRHRGCASRTRESLKYAAVDLGLLGVLRAEPRRGGHPWLLPLPPPDRHGDVDELRDRPRLATAASRTTKRSTPSWGTSRTRRCWCFLAVGVLAQAAPQVPQPRDEGHEPPVDDSGAVRSHQPFSAVPRAGPLVGRVPGLPRVPSVRGARDEHGRVALLPRVAFVRPRAQRRAREVRGERGDVRRFPGADVRGDGLARALGDAVPRAVPVLQLQAVRCDAPAAPRRGHRDVRGGRVGIRARGLQTTDREFGLGWTRRRTITDCHVAHHMFSDMPHYRLEKATAAVRGVPSPAACTSGGTRATSSQKPSRCTTPSGTASSATGRGPPRRRSRLGSRGKAVIDDASPAVVSDVCYAGTYEV